MTDIRTRLVREVLQLVRDPAQYIGGEMNAVEKPHEGRIRFAIAFPDTYSVGMSHLGIRILYSVLNDQDDIVCERSFCPQQDMEALLREKGIPLYSLESFTPLREFDILGMSLQYELCGTSAINMLDLADIPLDSSERDEDCPLVLGGGPVCGNPEPFARFFDAFLLGDGEETVVQIARLWNRYHKTEGLTRAESLERMAREIHGFYVPAFYDVEWLPSGEVASIRPNRDVPAIVRSALIMDLEDAPYPERPLVPVIPIIHERVVVEIMRGCLNGCRFCSAGMQYRPQRYRSVEKVMEIARVNYQHTGYDTVALLSLSSSDHPDIAEMADRLNAEFSPKDVGLSLPSLRIGKATLDITARLNEVRKSGLTFAPEVATDKQRAVVNKGINEAELIECVHEAFKQGWKLVKLYFMVGLPHETPEDREGIVLMAERVSAEGKKAGVGYAQVNVTVSTFIPKPHTPFQWAAQISDEEDYEIRSALRGMRPFKSVKLKFDPPFNSQLEGLIARGDRKVGELLLEAWKLGARLDAWPDHLNRELWLQAMQNTGISFTFFCQRERSEEEVLPWSHLSYGPTMEFLLDEKRKADRQEYSEICGKGHCNVCMTDIPCPNRC